MTSAPCRGRERDEHVGGMEGEHSQRRLRGTGERRRGERPLLSLFILVLVWGGSSLGAPLNEPPSSTKTTRKCFIKVAKRKEMGGGVFVGRGGVFGVGYNGSMK